MREKKWGLNSARRRAARAREDVHCGPWRLFWAALPTPPACYPRTPKCHRAAAPRGRRRAGVPEGKVLLRAGIAMALFRCRERGRGRRRGEPFRIGEPASREHRPLSKRTANWKPAARGLYKELSAKLRGLFLLHLPGVVPAAGGRSHSSAVVEDLLRLLDVLLLAAPDLHRLLLQGAGPGERDLPREGVVHLVHRVQVRGCVLAALAAGEQDDAGHRRRYAAHETLDRVAGNVLDRRLLEGVLAVDDEVWLQERPLQVDALLVEGGVSALERPLVDLEGSLDGVVALYKDLWLDDGHEAGLLREGREEG